MDLSSNYKRFRLFLYRKCVKKWKNIWKREKLIVIFVPIKQKTKQ